MTLHGTVGHTMEYFPVNAVHVRTSLRGFPFFGEMGKFQKNLLWKCRADPKELSCSTNYKRPHVRICCAVPREFPRSTNKKGSLVQRELSTKLTEGLCSKFANLQIIQNDSRDNSSVTPNGVTPPFAQRRLLQFG